MPDLSRTSLFAVMVVKQATAFNLGVRFIRKNNYETYVAIVSFIT